MQVTVQSPQVVQTQQQKKVLVMLVNPKTGDRGGFLVSTPTGKYSEVVEAYRAKLRWLPQFKGWVYDSSEVLA